MGVQGLRAVGAVGSVPRWHRGGHRFEPGTVHKRNGGVREWLNRAVSKTAMPERVSKVRILPPPLQHMLNFKKKNNQTASVKELAKQVGLLEERLKETTTDLASLRQAQGKAISKVGLLRFNPFGDIGGDQSFSVALLDSEDSGVVITSHYGKDMQRVYAKTITKGKSEYSLSKEEEKVILQARKLNNSS